MTRLTEFTNKYSLSKTLRFELRPQGKTLECIKESGLIDQDEQLKQDYQEVKKLIDSYHRVVIQECLSSVRLEGLEAFEQLYFIKRDELEDKQFENLQKELRKQIVKGFATNGRFKNLFKKELIQTDLPLFLDNEEDKKRVAKFNSFTTYFTGFHENRKNIYTSEPHSTAVGYRLIHQNLPKFLDNLRIYRTFINKHEGLSFKEIETELEEVLQGITVEEIFNLDFFNETLTQTGIDTYNIALGGRTLENGTKIKGINEYINLYRQKNKLKARELPNLKPLYKQILSESESASFLLDKFEKDEDLLAELQAFYYALTHFEFRGEADKNVFIELMNLFNRFSEADLRAIYIKNDVGLGSISNKIFGHWSIIQDALEYYYEKEINPLEGKKASKKYAKEKDQWLGQTKDGDKIKSFSIQTINKALELFAPLNEDLKKKYNKDLLTDYLSAFTIEDQHLITTIEKHFSAVSEILERGSLDDNQTKKKAETTVIKSFLDSIKTLLHFIKPLDAKAVSGDKDEGFYSDFDIIYDQLNLLTPLYNKTRNYLTQKAYSVEKFKMNFENNTLLDGWDVNKETANKGVLLRKEGLYYLAVMNKSHGKVFQNVFESEDTTGYQKVNYKLLPGPNKMLPKVFFSAKNIGFFNPSQEVQNIRNTSSHSKDGNPQKGFEKADFNLKDCHTLIDFFKESLAKHEDWKQFEFDFSPTSSYEDISGFYREVEHQGYKITYSNISTQYIDELVNEGKIYLFQIYNKDFSPYSKGKPNLHTIYWKAVFDERNLADVVYKLNGQAEIFYRRKSISYTPEKLEKGHHYEELKEKFDYPIIKDKRFAFDKFQFHVPITMNFKATGNPNINVPVLEHLKDNPEVKIIGLDRGERHLLYLTLVDQKGNIEEQYSLNEIVNNYKGKEYKKDYQALLHEKEGDRKKARENWGTIETIKELKEGYLSQVVHKIAQMMVEHNAIVVMEDLNFGFKRGRFHVEKQIYQKFEKMLIDKLNYLVFKEVEAEKTTGSLNALQLANKFESFQKLGKQSGFIFYVPAFLTSKIDPATGFVNQLRPKYESAEKAQNYFKQFTSIHFNTNKEWFEFVFDYKNFKGTTPTERKKPWVICTTPITRYAWNRNLNNGKGGAEAYNVTQELQDLCHKFNIPYAGGNNLIDEITKQDSPEFFRKLLKLLIVTASLRQNNGKKGDEEQDFILSPVADANGQFFNSNEAKATEPKDADANGAYHIALKGLWALEQINDSKEEELKKVKLAISNEQWLNFAQQKPFLS